MKLQITLQIFRGGFKGLKSRSWVLKHNNNNIHHKWKSTSILHLINTALQRFSVGLLEKV